MATIIKNWLPFHANSLHRKLPINHPPKFWVTAFSSVDRNGKFVSAIMKKSKTGCHFTETPCLSAERLSLLNDETEPKFSVYPAGHICVVLHCLIFFFVMKIKGIRIEFKGAIITNLSNINSIGYILCKIDINNTIIQKTQESR